MYERELEEAARIIAGARSAVAFTGAGISAESGIPTFRDPGGLWDRFDPDEIGTLEGFTIFARRYPDRLRQLLQESVDHFGRAQPNPAHYGLAELEKMGLLKSVITQNGDDLHSIAGSTRVFEVHGNLYRFKCLTCGGTRKHNREEILDRISGVLAKEPFKVEELLSVLPKCECSGFMRPDVVMFGEAVQQLPESFLEARSADVLLVLGTSAMVWPAAGAPYEAKRQGARLIEINPTTNAYRDITEVYIKDLSGRAMPQIVDKVKELLRR